MAKNLKTINVINIIC